MSIVDDELTGIGMVAVVRADVINNIGRDVFFSLCPNAAIGAWAANPICCNTILCLPFCDGINTFLIILSGPEPMR